MRINDLRPVPGSVHKKKRIGRGNASGHGTYSGRGIKGQKSRSGPDLRIGFEGGQIPLVRALSRMRGFTNRFRIEYEVINVGQLAALPANSDVTADSLRTAGIVKSNQMPVKILGEGELIIALNVEAHRFTASARAKIEAAGGKVTELTPAAAKEAPALKAAPAAEEPAEAEPVAEAPAARRPAARRRAAAAPAEDEAEAKEAEAEPEGEKED
jgi:large subunit ribosomal protein L15